MAPRNDIDLDGADAQDQAEVMDETHLTKDGEMIANFDTIADVYDATRDPGDSEDEPIDADDYEPEDLDALEVAEDELEDDDSPYQPDIGVNAAAEDFNTRDARETDGPGADEIAGMRIVRDADAVEGGEDDVFNFQSRGLSDADIAKLGYGGRGSSRGKGEPKPRAKPDLGTGAGPDDVEDHRDPHTEENLDHGVEETFPASDPVSISPGAD